MGQTPFWFAVGWRGQSRDDGLQKQAIAWLQYGLMEFGVGAKTAAGYGYFNQGKIATMKEKRKCH